MARKENVWAVFREIPEEIDKDLSLKWLVQIDLKVQTEATICATQEG